MVIPGTVRAIVGGGRYPRRGWGQEQATMSEPEKDEGSWAARSWRGLGPLPGLQGRFGNPAR